MRAKRQCLDEFAVAAQRSLHPQHTDNHTVQTFFPTRYHFTVFATTNAHSWALGQLVSGQHPLAAHMARNDRWSSALCPVCGLCDETIEHFLFECQVFAVQRSVLGLELAGMCAGTQGQLPMPSFYLSTPQSLRQLDRYLISTRRFFTQKWLYDAYDATNTRPAETVILSAPTTTNIRHQMPILPYPLRDSDGDSPTTSENPNVDENSDTD